MIKSGVKINLSEEVIYAFYTSEKCAWCSFRRKLANGRSFECGKGNCEGN
jgi:hypothetical protein